MEVLVEMNKRRPKDSAAIFPGAKGGLLSDVGINKMLHALPTVKELDAAATQRLRLSLPSAVRANVFANGAMVHGFRATARSWAAAKTEFAPFVLELAPAPENKDKVEAAYQRDTVLEKRKQLMAACGPYCANGNAVHFSRRWIQ